MKALQHKGLAGALLAGLFLLRATGAETTNSVPWSDSFESYTAGSSVIGTNGWTGADAGGGVVVSNPPIAAYTNAGGRTYPLASTHTNVLRTTTTVRNNTGSATGGVVAVEFLVWPEAMTETPLVSTNLHCAFYVNTNGNVVIWHQNRSGGVTNNEWRALTEGGVTVDTNAWNRFTLIQDYGHNMFRIRVNEGAGYLSDSAGWSQPGAGMAPTGTWFAMVKTNAWLSRVMFGCDSTSYVDDLLLATRSVTWSINGFTEEAANDGTIAPGTVFEITVNYDTFSGTNNETLGNAAVTVTNIPDGLTGVVTRVNATHLRLSLTGQASLHEAENSVSNLTVVLKDNAFTLGNAADVTGTSNGTISITYSNRPGMGALTPAGTNFHEGVANDGSISNTLTLTLEGTTFVNVSPLVPDTHYSVSNVPAGLTLVVDRTDTTTTVARLTDAATQHAAAHSTNLDLTFLDAAFQGTPASNVVGRSLSLAVHFTDPPVLTYSGTNFHETAANNGTIGNSNTITLAGETFTNDTFTAGVHYTAPAAVPPGLSFVVTYLDPTRVAVSLTNAASAHAASNSVSLTGFAFRDEAFSQVAAGNILGSSSAFAVAFSNQPALNASSLTFTEAAANNGTMGNSNTITLADGAVFANVTFESNTHFTVANVPSELVFGVTYDGPGQVTATLTGMAGSHDAGNSVSNVLVTFLDPAFTGVAAANIEGHPMTFVVAFSDPPWLEYSRTNFTERFGGQIDNTTPVTITLHGDTFAADVVSRITAAQVPAGLSAAFTRVGDTQLCAELTGAATANDSTNSVDNMTYTFTAGAFSATQPNLVRNYTQTLSVLFTDVEVYNTVPYEEPFEGHDNGARIAAEDQSWKALLTDPEGGGIDNDAGVAATLLLYPNSILRFPIETNHTKVLRVQDSMRVAVYSETAPLVYLDFMAQPGVRTEDPPADTNLQYAFYVSTNLQLVVWHRNRAVMPNVNEWLPLQGGPLIDTSRWMRVTVAQDYSNHMFQVTLNQEEPISDPYGWTAGGAAPTGSWFHMVQTNAGMSHFTVSGVGKTYVDDLTVRLSLPNSFRVFSGSVFRFR